MYKNKFTSEMLYAIMFWKKVRGSFLRQRIDWKLMNDEDTLIELLDVYCDYLPDTRITFSDQDGIHNIDLKNDVYERRTSEYKMIIDCKKKTGSFLFATGEKCSFVVNASIQKSYKDIRLKYKIDDDKKTIVITMKER